MATTRKRGSKTRKTNRGARREVEVLAPEPVASVPSAEDRRVVDDILDAIDQWVGGFDLGKVSVGEMVLRDVFDNDAKAMVRGDRSTNARLALLLEQSPKRRLSASALSLLLRVIAYDHLITGRYWKLLSPPVKEALLPLANREKPHDRETLQRLNKAAEHAIDFGLDARRARLFVREELRENGTLPRRKSSSRTVHAQLDRSLDLFGTSDGVARLAAISGKLDLAARTELAKKMTATAEAILAAAKKMKAR